MPDMEKVILAYKCCKNSYDRICEKCPYEKDCCHDGIPMFVIRKMVELLKEQQQQIWELQEQEEYLTDKLKKQETELCDRCGRRRMKSSMEGR